MSQIKVVYISSWEEGDIHTFATLDTISGLVTEIISSDEGADHEYLNREYIQFKDIKATVEFDEDLGEYKVSDPSDLADFNDSLKFHKNAINH